MSQATLSRFPTALDINLCLSLILNNTFQMNVLVAASRGGGIKERLPKGTIDTADVTPGAKLSTLKDKMPSILSSSGRLSPQTHVYIMAGVPDITIKLKTHRPRYAEVIYREELDETVSRVEREINSIATCVKHLGAIPVFCTITKCNIQKYNHSLLTKNKTSALHYT